VNERLLDSRLAAAGGLVEELQTCAPEFDRSRPGWPLGQAPVEIPSKVGVAQRRASHVVSAQPKLVEDGGG
jgi:hypothetical protein